jgi:hypothetical protein
MRTCTGLSCFRIGCSTWPLWGRQQSSGFHKGQTLYVGVSRRNALMKCNISAVCCISYRTYLTVLHMRVEKRQYIIGFAAEFRGAKLWMNVATAMFVCVSGTLPYTCSRSNTKYGLQHRMNTATVATASSWTLNNLTPLSQINPLKTKRVCFI